MDESIAMQIAKIKTQYPGVFGRRRTGALALCIQYSGSRKDLASLFRAVREAGHSGTSRHVHGNEYRVFQLVHTTDVVVVFPGHTCWEYGVYLELETTGNMKHFGLL